MDELPIKATPALEGSVGQLLYYLYQISVSNLSLYSKACESIQNSPFAELRKPMAVIQDHALAHIELIYSLWSPLQKSPVVEDESFRAYCLQFFQKYSRVAIVEKKSTLWIPLERQIRLIGLCETTELNCIRSLARKREELSEPLAQIETGVRDRSAQLSKFKTVLQTKVLQAKQAYAEPKPFL